MEEGIQPYFHVSLMYRFKNVSTEKNSNANIVERTVLRTGTNEGNIVYRPATKVMLPGNS